MVFSYIKSPNFFHDEVLGFISDEGYLILRISETWNIFVMPDHFWLVNLGTVEYIKIQETSFVHHHPHKFVQAERGDL